MGVGGGGGEERGSSSEGAFNTDNRAISSLLEVYGGGSELNMPAMEHTFIYRDRHITYAP